MTEFQAFAICHPKARAEGDIIPYRRVSPPWIIILTVNK